MIWDSHPLALGATPKQVFIDGIPQLTSPYVVTKPEVFQRSPRVPNFDEEAQKAVIYEGLPPLEPKAAPLDAAVVFQNVHSVYQVKNGVIEQIQLAQGTGSGTVVSRNGVIVCHGGVEHCANIVDMQDARTSVVDLEGGSISPGLVSFGSPLGLQHIDQEASTNDGNVIDPLSQSVPDIIGGDSAIIRAFDGLEYGTRDAL